MILNILKIGQKNYNVRDCLNEIADNLSDIRVFNVINDFMSPDCSKKLEHSVEWIPCDILPLTHMFFFIYPNSYMTMKKLIIKSGLPEKCEKTSKIDKNQL